jgi:hypothetical protein
MVWYTVTITKGGTMPEPINNPTMRELVTRLRVLEERASRVAREIKAVRTEMRGYPCGTYAGERANESATVFEATSYTVPTDAIFNAMTFERAKRCVKTNSEKARRVLGNERYESLATSTSTAKKVRLVIAA